jgi:hypothetical protein
MVMVMNRCDKTFLPSLCQEGVVLLLCLHKCSGLCKAISSTYEACSSTSFFPSPSVEMPPRTTRAVSI